MLLNKIKWGWVAGAFLLATGASGDRMVAVVNETPLTEQMLQHRITQLTQLYEQQAQPLPPQSALEERALELLIDTALQLQKAEEIGVEISQSEIDAAISDMAARQQLSRAEWNEQIEKQGLSLSMYRKRIGQDLRVARLQDQLLPPATVTNQEAQDYLKQHPQQFQRVKEYHLIDVRIALPEAPSAQQLQQAQAQATQIRQAFKKTSNLQKIIQSLSTKPTPTLVDLAWRGLESLPDEFIESITQMKQHDLSAPIRTPSGLHLLYLQGSRAHAVDTQVNQLHLAQILIKPDHFTETEAAGKTLQSIQNQIKRGDSSFEKIAKDFSQDPQSAPKGGDLGWVFDYDLPPAMVEALSGLQPGDLTDPIKTYDGWLLVKLIDLRQVDARSDIELRTVKQKLYRQRREQQLKQWLSELRQASFIQRFDRDRP